MTRIKRHENRPRKSRLQAYYRTVFADSVNEAMQMAERYARKGYILNTLTEWK